jgi:hypothetical protein
VSPVTPPPMMAMRAGVEVEIMRPESIDVGAGFEDNW